MFKIDMMHKISVIIVVLFYLASNLVAQSPVKIKGVAGKGVAAKNIPVEQPHYNIRQLTGKWQEIKRMNVLTRMQNSFTDTLQLNFNKRDSVLVREGMGNSKKGYAALNPPNDLLVAGSRFLIKSLSTNRLVVMDNSFIRTLKKKKLFYYETLGNIILTKENLSKPLYVNAKKLLGKWEVYRTQATPGFADSGVIKQIYFQRIDPDKSLSGNLTFIKEDMTYSVSFKAILLNGNMQLITEKHIWELHIFKADGKEFIFGKQGGLVYFSKSQ